MESWQPTRPPRGKLHATAEEQITVEGRLLREGVYREVLLDNQVLEYYQFELGTAAEEVLPCVTTAEVGHQIYRYSTRGEQWARVTGRMGRLVEGTGPDDGFDALIVDSWEPLGQPPGTATSGP